MQFLEDSDDFISIDVVLATLQVLKTYPVFDLKVEKIEQTVYLNIVCADVQVFE